MKYLSWSCLLVGGMLFAGTQDSEFNVNTRYTVETVVISGEGWTTNLAADHDRNGKLSPTLRKDVNALIGEKLNPPLLDEIAKRLRKEFHARTVDHRVLRGASPEYVQVAFDIRLKPTRFDVSVPKLLYSSTTRWTGALEGTATIGHNGFTAGLVSDADSLPERYTGMVARYENNHLGSENVRFNFAFEDFREEWDGTAVRAATAQAGELPDLYRARENLQPSLTWVVAKPLELTVGTSFERMQDQSPAVLDRSANALFTTLRYHRRLEGGESQQDLDAGYSLRAATRVLSSDFVYARHRWEFRYMRTRGKSVIIDNAMAGFITGRAPLFERFALGNGTTLRGWSMYDLDPLGGSRMLHNSAEYRYGIFQVFYDSGAVWDRGDATVLRHAAGIGLRQGVFSLAVAFPLRDGHIDPIFMVGMN